MSGVEPMSTPVSRDSAPHYPWGAGCEGWRLVDSSAWTVIEERVPAGAAEVRHFHERARQFFYVLTGVAWLEIEGLTHRLPAGSGLEVAPGQRHQFMNQSDQPVTFLVASVPSTQSDRINLV